MKKIIYSDYTKFIAVVLFVVSIVLGALVVTNGVTQYCEEKERVYDFENDFANTGFFSHMLVAPENAVFNAYFDIYTEMPLNGETIWVRNIGGDTYEEALRKRLNNLYCLEQIDYYIKINDTIYTNCGAEGEADFLQAQFYRNVSRDENGLVRAESSRSRRAYQPILSELSQFGEVGEITVCTAIKEKSVVQYQAIWERQKIIVTVALRDAMLFLMLGLCCLSYLICVCGKNKDGEHESIWIDNIWTEVHFAAMGGFCVGAVVICAICLDEYFAGYFPLDLLNLVVGAASAFASMLVITSLLSIIRNIKCKRFLESSVIFRILRWCFKTLIKAIKWIYRKLKSFKKAISYALSQKTGIILISMLFVYTALIGMFGFLGYHEALFIVFGVLLFFFGAFVVAYRAKDLDEVKKGVSEVRNGNVAYKIPELKSEDMKLFANNVNEIAQGLNESVAAKLKAERMKTELITNVSHDLKTPLTSIISYTELLSKMEDLPEEARDYAQIIANKSERLKILTQDLFDISKVQSGNETVQWEPLDVALLLQQSLGELDSEIRQSGLTFCVDVSKELSILADGRKMSRVLGNLLHNILKYTMKNTRVFISSYEENGEAVIELKNIASYPMEFTADEITGRFVRGDESRTGEGNGLGLAIAKSYTELCNGKFQLMLDGDLFKVILRFPKHH